jgi:hypothetical protein
MARKKREFSIFSLSFLDIMCCGFGAVLLIFLVMNHSIDQSASEGEENLKSEVNMLDEDVAEGKDGLVKLHNTLSELDQQMAEAKGLASRITEDKEHFEAQIQANKQEGYTEKSDIENRKAELLSLETQVEELRKASKPEGGTNVRAFIGEGNRQYLTGLKLDGQRVAILLDVSASMLADKLVQIIRLRNMGESVQRNAQKWKQTLDTVDWLTAQLPVGSKYQIITFNTTAKAALPETDGKWLEVADSKQLANVGSELHKIVPTGGTSLENAFVALQKLSPAPDDIFLITDGLPTQGASPPRSNKVTGQERQKLFAQAIRQLPSKVPVNIILEPMEGDPMAAGEFWGLAQASRGALLMPSKDWP